MVNYRPGSLATNSIIMRESPYSLPLALYVWLHETNNKGMCGICLAARSRIARPRLNKEYVEFSLHLVCWGCGHGVVSQRVT